MQIPIVNRRINRLPHPNLQQLTTHSFRNYRYRFKYLPLQVERWSVSGCPMVSETWERNNRFSYIYRLCGKRFTVSWPWKPIIGLMGWLPCILQLSTDLSFIIGIIGWLVIACYLLHITNKATPYNVLGTIIGSSHSKFHLLLEFGVTGDSYTGHLKNSGAKDHRIL